MRKVQTHVIDVWLDTKTDLNDNFTKPKVDLHIQITDTCHKVREVCACSYIFDKLVVLLLFFFLKKHRVLSIGN